MTFKIEKFRDENSTTIRLIGRMRAEHVSDLEKQISESESKVVLDLEELNLVDVEVVRFLGMCQRQGVTLLNCSPYIKEWMLRERSRGETTGDKRKKGRISSGDEPGGHE